MRLRKGLPKVGGPLLLAMFVFRRLYCFPHDDLTRFYDLGPPERWPLKRHSDATGIGAEHGAAILPRSKRSGDILPLLQHAVRDG